MVILVTKCWEFLRNFWRNIPEIFLGKIQGKFSGISVEIFQKNSQEFFGKKSEKILGISQKKCSKHWSLKNLLNRGPIQRNFQEFPRYCLQELVYKKFLKATNQNLRTWRNSLLLLPGYKLVYFMSNFYLEKVLFFIACFVKLLDMCTIFAIFVYHWILGNFG